MPSADVVAGAEHRVDAGYGLRRRRIMAVCTSSWKREIRDEIIPFPPGLLRVFAHTMAANAASRRVMQKSGLTLVHLSPYAGSDAVDGSAQGEVEYELTMAKWNTRR
jgi:hypothetical protein